MSTIIILPIHGMGQTPPNFADSLRSALKQSLGPTWRNVVFKPIYYQDVIQENQTDVWTKMRLEGKLAWAELRKFMLYAFSDAATLEHFSDSAQSAYVGAQLKIRATLQDALSEAGGDATTPIVVVAHSLGGQVMSNYLWDSQQLSPAGVWKHHPLPSTIDAATSGFLRGDSLRLMLTAGCNIPVFVAGLKRIEPIKVKRTDFEWHNFYDKDDVLGWPLRPLSNGYKKLVKADVEMNSGNWMISGWNPLSHGGYWTDADFIKPAAKLIKAI